MSKIRLSRAVVWSIVLTIWGCWAVAIIWWEWWWVPVALLLHIFLENCVEKDSGGGHEK
ncbi:hypothetical protein [Paracidovorax anthurii]|uniref:hypothetical protein n=1 Tax=Paracidovorax anthurii TaxID=78229 RepID=UPI0014727EE4|nr:hypothetical protein [Paracidovorax anthurii]